MEDKNFYILAQKYMQYVSMKLKPQSSRSIISRFKSYILPYFKDKNIDEITTLDYLNWQNNINKKQFLYGYKKALHYTMVSFYSYLDTFYEYKNNIPKKVGNFNNLDIPKEMNFWTYEEYSKFEKSFLDKDLIYKTFFIVLFHTGIREGEALALKFSDFNNESIHVCKTISKENFNGSKIETIPKTKDSIRYIKLDNYTINAINNLKDYYKKQYNEFNDNYYIFGGKKTISVTTLERKKRKYIKVAGVKNIRIHDFRHSHATFLIKNNVPIIEVSRRLGHSDINTTIKTYSHLSNDYEKRAIDALNSLK